MDFERKDSVYYKLSNITKPKHKYTKMALFSFENTLVKSSSSKYEIMFNNVTSKLKNLAKNNYVIGLLITLDSEYILSTVSKFINKLNIPIVSLVSIDDDINRKPNTGILRFLDYIGFINISYDKLFYVGNEGGRKNDISSNDRKFAFNLNIKYYTPEEYFINYPIDNNYILDDLGISQFKDVFFKIKPKYKFLLAHNEIIITIGFPTTGKSTFINKFISPLQKYKILDHYSNNLCEKYVKNGYSVVIDDTNITVKERKKYISIAHKYGFIIRGFYFNIGIDLAKHLNNFSMKKSNNFLKKNPDSIYKVMEQKFVFPMVEEGFSDIVNINFCPEFYNNDEEYLFYELS